MQSGKLIKLRCLDTLVLIYVKTHKSNSPKFFSLPNNVHNHKSWDENYKLSAYKTSVGFTSFAGSSKQVNDSLHGTSMICFSA